MNSFSVLNYINDIQWCKSKAIKYKGVQIYPSNKDGNDFFGFLVCTWFSAEGFLVSTWFSAEEQSKISTHGACCFRGLDVVRPLTVWYACYNVCHSRKFFVKLVVKCYFFFYESIMCHSGVLSRQYWKHFRGTLGSVQGGWDGWSLNHIHNGG